MTDKELDIKNPETTYDNIRNAIVEAQNKIVRTVNSTLVETYWKIGEQIFKECGENDRAEYGKYVINYLAERLTKEFGKGFNRTNLRYMRQFCVAFPIYHALRGELSWTHYRLIMSVENPQARAFYVEECAKCGWSTRQLERQIHSLFYERLLSSHYDESVRNEIYTLEPKKEVSPSDILKSTYILEFLGLEDNTKYHEKELEQAIIDNLQKFLLEMGRGFTFVARQKRIALEDDNFYIDLVFYNVILRCYVLIDLKIGKITHQDLGQMLMYVNYYTEELMNEGDNPPIGLVLGADKNDSVIKYTLKDKERLFASKYKTCLPTEEELKRELNLAKYKELTEE